VSELYAVTGAFGFSGKYITRRLLAAGARVTNLTGHPDRPNPFGDRVTTVRADFNNRAPLVEAMSGARVLFNTYWIRFERGAKTFDRATENTRVLIDAAAEAGVERIVHLSVTNPSEDSPLPYFRGKAIVEQIIRDSGLSYAILRPAVLFGDEGILINNIAWMLRRFPVFAIFGAGRYQMQPIFVDDLAGLAVAEAARRENVVADALGPETYAFEELVRTLRDVVRSRARLVHVPAWVGLLASRPVGWMVRDVVLTADEVRGLMDNLLVGSGPAAGKTKLSEWLGANADTVGRRYLSEVKAHYRQ
jgi:NADH dehydrogenase